MRPLLRLLILWVAEAAGLLLLAWILPGVSVAGPGAAFVAVALIGILNAVVFPAFAVLGAGVAAATFGLLALVLNGAIVLLASTLDRGLVVDGLGAAIVLVLGLTLVNVAVSGLLSLDDEGSFYRAVVLRQARRARREAGQAERDPRPGVLFLEIDGLGEPVLREAIAAGRMPTLAGWLADGSHRITGWECDLSSQTSASQAGLLHGSNEGIPAFRWHDREAGRAVVSSKPADAALIEERRPAGRGLLRDAGSSRGNLLSGEAAHRTLTLSAFGTFVGDRRDRARAWRDFLGNPYAMPRTLLMFAGDVVAERRAARRQRREDVRPRIERGGRYPFLRAATTSLIPEVTVSMLIGDIFRGVPSAYATFVSYDEVAHHSGIRAPDALAILERLDRAFARLERSTRLAPRPYEIVVLSDHGQSQGATFRQCHGATLEGVVQELSGRAVTGGGATTDEAAHQVGAALDEAAAHGPRVVGWAARRARPADDAASPVGDAPPPPEDGVLVFASGNLGLVYFPHLAERPTLEAVAAEHPRLLAGLAEHPGVGFVAGVSAHAGALALGAEGSRELETGQVTGRDPLGAYGPRAAAHLRRELAFANAPDVLVMSAYDPETEEVAAFEELVGSHGGLGGPQARPFLLHPVGFPTPAEELVGAATVHELLRSWLALSEAPAAAAAVR